jgi:hypothetical protein
MAPDSATIEGRWNAARGGGEHCGSSTGGAGRRGCRRRDEGGPKRWRERAGRFDADGDARAETDTLDDLAHEITTLYAHVHAATHRLLTLIARFDRLRGWEAAGHRSCAYWLAFNTGIDLGAAREKVRTARALVELPETSGSMARGELSFAKVRALTRVATPENEAELLELARAGTAATLDLSRLDEQERERERHRSRSFSVVPDIDGMYVVRGRLDPEVGAVLMRAVEAAQDALYRKERAELAGLATTLGVGEPRQLETTPRQRRADAVGLLSERALSAGFDGAGDEAGRPNDVTPAVEQGGVPEGTGEQDAGEARKAIGSMDGGGFRDKAESTGIGTPAAASRKQGPTLVSGSRAERYQVVIHVDEGTLRADGELGRSELEDGTRVSAETSRRLTCDGSTVRLTRGADGSVLDVGRRKRTIPPSIRRALEVRDRGCRFPGCGLRFTDAHHVRHWADGGRTKLENLVLLCRRHHRAVHEGGFRAEVDFYDPKGLPLPDVPDPLYVGERPVEALIRRNRIRGVNPRAWASAARYRREIDIPWAIEAAAREALDSG